MARKRSPNGFGNIRKKVVNGSVYYEGRYTDPILHKQKSVCATTERECRQKLKEVFAKITTGAYVTPSKKRVRDWAAEWLEGKQNLKPGTRADYQRHIDQYIVPEIGAIYLSDLRPIHCQEFVHKLKKPNAEGKSLSAKTIGNILGTLHSMLDTAVRLELIASNPANKLEKPTVEKKAVKVIEKASQMDFLSAVENSQYKNIHLMGLHTGARISEVLGLRWSRVDLENGAIVIDAQLQRQRKGVMERTLASTKTGNIRTVIIPDFIVDLLREVKRNQAEAQLRAGSLWNNEHGLVFTREDGSPMPHTTIANDFKKIAIAMGKPDLSYHALRHTYATDEIASGTDPKTVADTLGHSTVAMTMDVYAAASTEAKRAAAQRRQDEFAAQKLKSN
jgi:integrase